MHYAPASGSTWNWKKKSRIAIKISIVQRAIRSFVQNRTDTFHIYIAGKCTTRVCVRSVRKTFFIQNGKIEWYLGKITIATAAMQTLFVRTYPTIVHQIMMAALVLLIPMFAWVDDDVEHLFIFKFNGFNKMVLCIYKYFTTKCIVLDMANYATDYKKLPLSV